MLWKNYCTYGIILFLNFIIWKAFFNLNASKKIVFEASTFFRRDDSVPKLNSRLSFCYRLPVAGKYLELCLGRNHGHRESYYGSVCWMDYSVHNMAIQWLHFIFVSFFFLWDVQRMLMTPFWCLLLALSIFEPFFSVSIADFEYCLFETLTIADY